MPVSLDELPVRVALSGNYELAGANPTEAELNDFLEAGGERHASITVPIDAVCTDDQGRAGRIQGNLQSGYAHVVDHVDPHAGTHEGTVEAAVVFTGMLTKFDGEVEKFTDARLPTEGSWTLPSKRDLFWADWLGQAVPIEVSAEYLAESGSAFYVSPVYTNKIVRVVLVLNVDDPLAGICQEQFPIALKFISEFKTSN